MRALAFIAVLISSTALAAPTHPLDPLAADEIARSLAILKQSGKIGETTLFPYLMLKEPPKKEVLAWRSGQPFRREALVVVYDRKLGKTAEATIDLRTGAIAEWKERPGVQPSVLLSEFDAVPPIVKADPRYKAAMARRGITNLDDVQVDAWAYGNPDTDLSKHTRLLRALTYYKKGGTNFYARPVEGITVIVDMDKREVAQLVDTEALPIPPQMSELDEKTLAKLKGSRPPLKPLRVVQAKGPSFAVEGSEVRWQNWRFRFTMHPREGLVLQMVEYEDHGKRRPVLYRASLSEMMVPYGHPDTHWTYRNAFDEGEYGIGRYSGSLEVGTDVPDNARLFEARFVDDFGKPYVVKNAVALYERDGGLLWKHLDMYGGSNTSRRGRDLVIGFITTISNYDYGLNWVFHQDGTLELEAQLTGIMLAKGSAMTTMAGMNHAHTGGDLDGKFGHLVAPNVVAPHHQHFFNFRIDMDVDGAEHNEVLELDSNALPAGKDNPALNAFTMSETSLTTEKKAQRDLDFQKQRKWKVVNREAHNGLGYQTGYILVPGENAAPFLKPEAFLRKRGAFIDHPFWATQENDDERYAAGIYPSQAQVPDGLPVWTAKDRPLVDQDVVLWYTFCVTHAPRPEEWPVMTTHRTGFKLIPAGFFDRNPALDVAR